MTENQFLPQKRWELIFYPWGAGNGCYGKLLFVICRGVWYNGNIAAVGCGRFAERRPLKRYRIGKMTR